MHAPPGRVAFGIAEASLRNIRIVASTGLPFPVGMDQSSHNLSLIWLTFFAAGMIKGLTGMGLPTVAMGILGSLVSPLAAASLLLAPSLVTNIWQLVCGPNFAALWRRLWPMMAGIAVGTAGGSRVLVRGSDVATTLLLGACLIVYAGYTLRGRQVVVSTQAERRLSPFVGLATGLVTGATGVLVIPAVPFLQALNLDRDELVQALGLSFTTSTLSLACGLWYQGAVSMPDVPASLMAVVPALLGMAAGQAFRSRISQAKFRACFLVVMLLLGLEMVVRSLIR